MTQDKYRQTYWGKIDGEKLRLSSKKGFCERNVQIGDIQRLWCFNQLAEKVKNYGNCKISKDIIHIRKQHATYKAS